MNLNQRLRRLEADRRVAAGKRPCADCGGPKDWRNWKPGPDEVKVRVCHGDGEVRGPDYCPGCGRQLVYRIEFDRCGAAHILVLAWACVLAACVIGAALWA